MAGTNIVERCWDEFGRTAGYVLNVIRQTTIGYDQVTARIESMVVNGVTNAFRWTYLTGSDLRYSLAYPNGLTASWAYDANDQLLQVRDVAATGVISQYDYVYDAAGRRIKIARSGSAMSEPRTDAYGYNVRNELVSATRQGGTNFLEYAYRYDDIGNRLSSFDLGVNRTYTANNLNQYAVISASVNPVYDVDGNMKGDGSFSYTYDAENRLVSVCPVLPSVGSFAVENRYDHKHRRVQKIVKQYDGNSWMMAETHTFVWDGNNIVLEKIEFANGTDRTFEYFWGADKSGSEQGAGGVEGLQAVSVDGAFYIPCYDHNGNIVLYVSENGSIAAQFNYHPYGNVIDQTDAKCDDFSFRFSTKFTDVETGLVSFQFRHYHPAPGRWLNRDPIGEIGGNNLYIFSANSPSVYCDVLGYSWEIKRDGAIFAKAKATSSTDTFQSLAELLKLDATDYKLWAHTTDSSPIRCKEYGTIGSAMWLWSDFLWVTKVASIF